MIGRCAVRVLLGAALLLLVTVGLGPLTGAYRLATVLSGSMGPGMPAGSVAVLVPVDPADLRVGDVITYRTPTADRHVVTHRVVDVVEPGSRPALRTQGDANASADPWVARMVGSPAWRRVAVLPYAGTAIRFFRSAPIHHATVHVVPVLLLVAMLLAIWSPRVTFRFRFSQPKLRAIVFVAVFVMVGFPPDAMATFTKTITASNALSAAPDWIAPLVSTTVIAKQTGYLAGKIKQGGQYYVYANASDSNPYGTPAGIASEVTNVSQITTGSSSVSLATAGGPWSVNGVSYAYRSALLAANGSLSGTKSYTITSTDLATIPNVRVQPEGGDGPYTVTVDNTAPSAADIQTTGDGDGNAEQGETIVFTFSEEIDPQSILSGWTGVSTTVQVHLIDGNLILFLGAPDTVRIFNAAGSSQLPLGDVALPGAGYNVGVLGLPATTMEFVPSTMVKSAGSNVITITLGPRTAGSPDPGQSGAMSWDSSTTPYDAAGNPAEGDVQGESGGGDKEF